MRCLADHNVFFMDSLNTTMERATSATGVAGWRKGLFLCFLANTALHIFIRVANELKWRWVHCACQDAAQPVGDELALLNLAAARLTHI
jgi:hypothetical protein